MLESICLVTPFFKTAFVHTIGSEKYLYCNAAIRLLYPDRDPHGRYTETYPANKQVYLPNKRVIAVTVGQVDNAFAQGWRKLSTELKLKVLAYNLTYDGWVRITVDGSRSKDILCGPRLRAHLALGKDFALATQVFYEKNTISIFGGIMPPLHVRQFIRTVVITAAMPKNFQAHIWLNLQKLANKKTEFPALQEITIRLHPVHGLCGADSCGIARKGVPDNVIRFSCKGTFLTSSAPRHHPYTGEETHVECRRVDCYLRKLITFTE